nr:hypothetical protein [Tanacetum cinerariifolium]
MRIMPARKEAKAHGEVGREASATIKKVNDVVQLRALIDGKQVVITEDVIRQDLHLDDVDGVKCSLNEEIFAELTHMGYCISAKRNAWNKFSCFMASAVICLATGVETPLFASMLVQPLPQEEEEEEEAKDEIPNALTPPSPTNAPSPPIQDHTPTPYASPLASPLQEQPSLTTNSSMSLLTTLMETYATLSNKGRIDQDVSAATKDVSAAEPTVFDDEERLQDEEIKKATAREKQENDDLERAQVLQKQYDDKEENIDWNTVTERIQEKHLDNIKKYQSLKKKLVSIAQARKNMIIYLKNMAGYKMEHFRGMTYDKVRPIFEREYKKVQTLFKHDKDVEEPKKKRVAEETLLQESFKKLKAVEVSSSDSTQETPSNDTKEISEKDVQNMLKIILVSKFKVEALQVNYPIIDWEIHSEGSRTYWKIIRVG